MKDLRDEVPVLSPVATDKCHILPVHGGLSTGLLRKATAPDEQMSGWAACALGRALERHVLEEVRHAVVGVTLIPTPSLDPHADRRRLAPGCLAGHPQSVRQGRNQGRLLRDRAECSCVANPQGPQHVASRSWNLRIEYCSDDQRHV